MENSTPCWDGYKEEYTAWDELPIENVRESRKEEIEYMNGIIIMLLVHKE